MKVAFLGPLGSFSGEAVLKVLPKSELLALDSFPKIFSTVESSKADLGVIPIENSIEGGINATLDALMNSNLVIVGEFLLNVNQCFLSNEKDKSKITKIFSHPQGFAQCRDWINKNYPSAELVEYSSTARAAERASSEANTGAIASEASAKMFSIKVLGKNISDSDGNTTRFAIISAPKNAKEFSLKHKSGKPKTSIVFAVKNKPGSLFDAIKSFRDFGVNMTKIESRPSKKSAWEYVFFVDLDGLTGDSNVSAALKELGKHCNFVKVLGSFLMIE